jgi:hypothetical protein
MIKNNSSKKEQGNVNNNKECYDGDFDFIISKVNSNLLKKIFDDKKRAPFIFYGSIDIEKEKEFDIIGE